MEGENNVEEYHKTDLSILVIFEEEMTCVIAVKKQYLKNLVVREGQIELHTAFRTV